MQTSKWGPPMWYSLHATAHNFDPDNHDIKAFRNHFLNIGNILPCKYCRQSFKKYTKELDIDDYILKKPHGLSYWLYLMHNKVNEKLREQGLNDKKDPTFKQVCAKYEKIKADCSRKKDLPPTCRMPEMKDRCQATTKRNRQCSRKQCRHGLCEQHCRCSRKRSRKTSRKRSRKTSRKRSRKTSRKRSRKTSRKRSRKTSRKRSRKTSRKRSRKTSRKRSRKTSK